ncbi:MAG: C45 family peptidase [Rikenellaceae bacterium]
MKHFFKWLSITIIAMLLLPIFVLIVLYNSADMGEPDLSINPSEYQIQEKGDTLYCNQSYLRQSSSGLWELYIKGSTQQRGATQGALTKELMKYQEDVFIDQIREIIPSDGYLSFLRNFIVIFNRNLGRYIPLEYREEIVAMSEFCTDEYNAIGTPYERQLNYHAAHDIGHTMQQYMLVGCSSFGVWGDKSSDGELLIGRNFDFYVGDDFAKNKIITFASPESGYRYASVGWAGMVGVLSGMNECGLTITINAAKGAIPTSAAMPISILTREILQYAATIEEAYKIAQKHQTFVSESLLIGSAADGKCAIIEKTPDKIALYNPQGEEQIICTNHYQSIEFEEDSYNVENIKYSDSKYRYELLAELLANHETIDHQEAANTLRNRYGKGGKDIGIGNEMTLNQSIAHHSVIFAPCSAKMWVTTDIWQSGEFECYDLRRFFERGEHPTPSPEYRVRADEEFIEQELPRLIEWRAATKILKDAIWHRSKERVTAEFISNFKELNPNHYYTYRLLGDFYATFDEVETAREVYRQTLNCEIPYLSEREEIENIIKKMK